MIRPRIAMLLAAGIGTRMRPLTEGTAKPLLPLAGRPLLDHALDRLADAQVERVVVNMHWQADRVASHLTGRAASPEIILRREARLLDTGGSVASALDLLGPEPFYVVNGDAFWLNGPTPALERLAAAWDGTADAIMLVHRAFQVDAEFSNGDFAVDPWGLVRRPKERELVPYVYAGVQIVSPALLTDAPAPPFSFNVLWDRAIAAKRLRAVVHDGLWFHLSTPPDLVAAEEHLHVPALGDAR